MAFKWLALVEFHQIFVTELALIDLVVDRFARDLASIDEQSAFGSFEQNSVVATAGDDHFNSVLVLALHSVVVSGVVAIINRGVAILEFNRMLGVGSVDLDGAHSFLIGTDRPCRDIDVVSTPVGELSAGIFVPPAELIVAAFLDVVDHRRLAEPHVPIESFRRHFLLEGAAHIATVDPNGHGLDLPQQSLLDHVDCSQKPAAVAALLGPDEHHLVFVLAAGIADQLVLFESQRQRLLTENMLASLQGFDRDLHVPVIGSHNADDIDVVTFQNFSIVAIGVSHALAEFRVVLSPIGMPTVDIAHGQDVTEIGVLMCIACPHASDADTSNAWTGIGRLVGERRLAPGKEGQRTSGSSQQGRLLEKITTIRLRLLHTDDPEINRCKSKKAGASHRPRLRRWERYISRSRFATNDSPPEGIEGN